MITINTPLQGGSSIKDFLSKNSLIETSNSTIVNEGALERYNKPEGEWWASSDLIFKRGTGYRIGSAGSETSIHSILLWGVCHNTPIYRYTVCRGDEEDFFEITDDSRMKILIQSDDGPKAITMEASLLRAGSCVMDHMGNVCHITKMEMVMGIHTLWEIVTKNKWYNISNFGIPILPGSVRKKEVGEYAAAY